MRETPTLVKARGSLPPEPGLEVGATQANVLALAHGGELATPDRFVDVSVREAQLGGNLRYGEQLVAGGGVGFSRGRQRRADHLHPQSRPDLLERTEQSQNLVRTEIGYALGICDHEGEIRWSVGAH